MKKAIFSLLILFAGFPVFSQLQRGTGLVPVPKSLSQAFPTAVMSSLNLGDELPDKVNLAEGRIIPRDQSILGSCTCFASGGALSLMLRLRDNLSISNVTWLSTSFLYNQVMHGVNGGSSFYENFVLMKNKGVCAEIIFPYTMDTSMKPDLRAFRDAANHKIKDFSPVEINAETFRKFLAMGYPVMIGMKTSSNFFEYNGGIYRPNGDIVGNHGITLVGYNENERLLTAVNSYGDSWGAGGYFNFRYEEIPNFIFEAFIFEPETKPASASGFPANLKASKGSYANKIKLSWAAVDGAVDYEIFRIDSGRPSDPRQEVFVSLGTSSNNSFEDLSISKDSHYFYYVRTNFANTSSDFSFPVEGYAGNEKMNTAPGTPFGFTARLVNNKVVFNWEFVESAERYTIYSFRFDNDAWIKIGETTETTLIATPFVEKNCASISYIVVAENRYGKSLPSDASVVFFEDPPEPDDSDDNIKPVKYIGPFYRFPTAKFLEAEKKFLAKFIQSQQRFENNFKRSQQRFLDNFGGKK